MSPQDAKQEKFCLPGDTEMSLGTEAASRQPSLSLTGQVSWASYLHGPRFPHPRVSLLACFPVMLFTMKERHRGTERTEVLPLPDCLPCTSYPECITWTQNPGWSSQLLLISRASSPVLKNNLLMVKNNVRFVSVPHSETIGLVWSAECHKKRKENGNK